MYCLYVTDPTQLTNPDHTENYGRVGALISVSRNPITPIPGTAVKEVARLDKLYTWDESAQDSVYNRGDRFLKVDEFFERFTSAEEDAFLSNAPAVIKERMQHFRDVGRKLDLDSSRVNNLLDQMEAAGILTAQRRAEVQSGN